MISITHLSKSYGNIVAVNDISFSVKKGEVFALLGLNGAGKSTTIGILCSLVKKTCGKVYIDGYDLDFDGDKIKEIVNLSPQETAIAGNLTVRQNLSLIASLYGLSNADERVEKMITDFSLENKADCRAKTLSGGQKRRLSIAMACITEPKVLILDEPTLGLDIVARKELWRIISSYKGKTTVILTTHYLEEAQELADRIAILNNGYLSVVGTEKQIIKYANTADFESAFIRLAGGCNEN